MRLVSSVSMMNSLLLSMFGFNRGRVNKKIRLVFTCNHREE